MVKAAVAAPSFVGFRPGAMQFWHELAAEMNRDWFLANKDRYQREWVEPMTALLAAVSPQIAAACRPLIVGKPTVMRIHRDVRFAKDKAPYKTHIGGVVTATERTLSERGNVALYIHLGMNEEFVGAGEYMFDRDRLASFRRAVAGKPGVALATLVARLRAAGYVVGGHDNYKKVPKGFDPEHPRAELLLQKGLTAVFPPIPKGLLHKPGLVAWMVEHCRATAPLVKWLSLNP
jgi:uncharacterized protein (TIGR02453 family)